MKITQVPAVTCVLHLERLVLMPSKKSEYENKDSSYFNTIYERDFSVLFSG